MKHTPAILLTACITLCLFALAPGCKKSVDIGAEHNKVLFWCSDTTVGDTITVTLRNSAGSAANYITEAKAAANCDVQGVARFSTKAWNYDYTAVSNWGWTWQGSIEAKNVCNIYELKKADATVPDYYLTFWSREAANGTITVIIDGNYQITLTNGKEATACGQSGFGTLLLSPGIHRYTATAANGKTWQDTVLLDHPCRVYELR